MKKLLSLVLTLVLLLSVMPLGAVSAASDPTIVVDQVSGKAGDTVTVNVSLKNNPGFISAKLSIEYDSDVLEITSKAAGEGFNGMAFSQKLTANPYIANWVDSINPDNTTNGAFVTLTFKIKDNAKSGFSPIKVTYDPEDVYNVNWDNVYFAVEDGGVDVEGAAAPTIKVDEVSGKAGDTVTVNVSLENNPGIISAKLLIEYDFDVLEITGKTAGAGFSGMAFSQTLAANPYIANWVDSINPDNTTNGAFVTLTFKIKDTAASGVSPITVTYDPADVYNAEWSDIYFDVVNGSVTVAGCEHASTKTETQNRKEPTCTATGSYDTVTICNDCGAEISRVTTTINALGHTASAAVEENRKEAGCDTKGSYDLVVYCSVCKAEISRTPKEIAATGHNAGAPVVENRKEATCTSAGSYDTVTYCTKCEGEITRVTTTIDALGHNAGAAVVENSKEATCTEEGSYDSVVRCTVCQAELSRETKAIAALGHTAGTPVEENRVEVSCTQDGSYDEVVKCTVCQAEISRDTIVTGKATGHKYEDGTCSVCGAEDPSVTKVATIIVDQIEANAGDTVDVKVSVKNNPGIVSAKLKIAYDSNKLEIINKVAGAGFSGMAFSQTLTANPYIANWVDTINPDNTTDGAFVTLTFKIKETAISGNSPITVTYDPEDVYNASFDNVEFVIVNGGIKVAGCEHTTTESKIENRVEATCTTNGSYDEVTVCTDCGAVILKNTRTIPATGHTRGEAVEENRVEATCKNAGSYDMVVYCTSCEAELSRESFEIEKLAHTAGEAVEENRKEATCKADGSYESVVYCSVCGEELSRETIVIEKGNHIKAAAVEENRVEADCENEGSYESVVYCVVCGEEISRKTITIEALGHTRGEAVIENKVDGDCLTDGSYDKVVYCTVCDKEISRETVIVEATGHKFNNGVCEICGVSNVSGATIMVETVTADKDETVDVKINLVNNPGVISLKIEIDYDTNLLELVSATAGEEFSEMAYSEFITDIPFIANWLNSIEPDNTASDFLTLTFKVKADAVPGLAAITVKYNQDDIFNSNYEDVTFAIENGGINVVGCAHTSTYVANENVIDATCLTGGSYDKVTYCNECQEEISRETIIVEALGHNITTFAAKDPTCTEDGYTVHIGCTRCDYASSYEIIPATGHTAGEAVEENRVEAGCETEGSYDMVVYCTVCGEELSRETFVIEALGHDIIAHDAKAPTCTEIGWNAYETCSRCDYTTYAEIEALGHTAGEAVEENRVAADCVNTGSYDLVVYCAVCGEELSRETVVIEALGHDLTAHDAKAPTCTEIGWNAYETCSRCDYTTYVEIAATGHTEAKAVVENIIEPNCVNKGSYDMVVYCEDCGVELSRTTVEIAALGHTTVDAFIENYVEPDCVNKGSYEIAIYCTVCGKELGRKTVEIEPIKHIIVKHNAKAPTCTEIGWDAYESCLLCGYTTYVEKAALGHTYGPTTVVEPTFSAEGYSVHTCTVCGHVEKFDFVDALPYLIGDVDGDGKVTNKDLGMLNQYINTWEVDIIIEAADVNGDGKIDNKDAGILNQYINNWDVDLG